VLVVTHAESLAAMADRLLHIKDGKLAPDGGSPATNDVAARNVKEALQTKRGMQPC